MKIWTNFHTVARYGAHPSVWPVGEYFRFECPPFGSSIHEFDLHAYFDTPTNEIFTTPFDSYIKKLPRFRYSSTKQSFSIHYLSRSDSRILDGIGPPRLEVFSACADEAYAAICSASRRLSKVDEFDYVGFTEFIKLKIQNIPRTTADFKILIAKIKK